MYHIGLSFEVSDTRYDATTTVELIPNGSNIAITSKNVNEYIHQYAHYKLNRQTQQQTKAFMSGFHQMISVDWTTMFSARELQLLISGEEKPIDIEVCKYVS